MKKELWDETVKALENYQGPHSILDISFRILNKGQRIVYTPFSIFHQIEETNVLPINSWLENDRKLCSFDIFCSGNPGSFCLCPCKPDRPNRYQTCSRHPLVRMVCWFSGSILRYGNHYHTPRIEATLTFSMVVAGQLFMALFMDHYGFLGVSVQPIS